MEKHLMFVFELESNLDDFVLVEWVQELDAFVCHTRVFKHIVNVTL